MYVIDQLTVVILTYKTNKQILDQCIQSILGKAKIGSKVFIDKKQVKVSKDGYFVFGIDRDRKFDLEITEINNGKKNNVIKKVFKRTYNIQRIDGVP